MSTTNHTNSGRLISQVYIETLEQCIHYVRKRIPIDFICATDVIAFTNNICDIRTLHKRFYCKLKKDYKLPGIGGLTPEDWYNIIANSVLCAIPLLLFLVLMVFLRSYLPRWSLNPFHIFRYFKGNFIACSIVDNSTRTEVKIHNTLEGKCDTFFHNGISVYNVIKSLVKRYGNKIGIIVVALAPTMRDNQMKRIQKECLNKYGNLVHFPAKDEMNFSKYLIQDIKYHIGEYVILFGRHRTIHLYQCTGATKGRITWRKTDRQGYEYTAGILNFRNIVNIFHLKMDQVHIIFENSQEQINSLHGPQLSGCNFKSINFVGQRDMFMNSLTLARNLISDPQIPILVEIDSAIHKYTPKGFTVQDSNFVKIPKLINEYESKTDAMGVDFGSSKSVLTALKNREIHVIPFDPSSPGDLWTESMAAFDNDKNELIIGKAAAKLEEEHNHIIFDAKLLCHYPHRWNRMRKLLWSFDYSFRDKQIELKFRTSQGLKTISLAKINELFLGEMIKAANDYQNQCGNQRLMKKAVFTVPRYFSNAFGRPYSMIYSIIEAANSANIEITDIIEDTHADLLYYMANERHCQKIKAGMKIAVFDIGGGTWTCRIYEISEHENREYATCLGELFIHDDVEFCGRNIDMMIAEELQKSIPEDLKNKLKLTTLETAKQIKHRLSSQPRVEFTLSEIYPLLNGTVTFTKRMLESKLKNYFSNHEVYCVQWNKYPLPTQNRLRCERQVQLGILHSPFKDVDMVFLAGGTCRIPFVQGWIKKQFPKAEVIMDGNLETITATGAAIHALQVLNREITPYVNASNSDIFEIIADLFALLHQQGEFPYRSSSSSEEETDSDW